MNLQPILIDNELAGVIYNCIKSAYLFELAEPEKAGIVHEFMYGLKQNYKFEVK